MNPIERLTEYFMHFPGIGPRQAKRFVYYLLTRDPETLGMLSDSIKTLKTTIRSCKMCFRFFPKRNLKNDKDENVCNICGGDRDHSILMVVPRDNDLEQIEKSKAYKGI